MTREVLTQLLSFQLDGGSGVPAYLQLVEQVEQALRMGTLAVGDQLPTVKQVVAEVAVNPNTVLKAYRELEREGLVAGRQGLGTFVLQVPVGPSPGTHTKLARSLQRWIGTARAEGLDDAAIEAMLRAQLRARSEADVA
jgi:GntR family transcriptional regulator